MALVCINGIIIGLETDGHASGPAWEAIGFAFVIVFTVELAVKLYAFEWLFFSEVWNVFDFGIVTVSLIEGILHLVTSDDSSGDIAHIGCERCDPKNFCLSHMSHLSGYF